MTRQCTVTILLSLTTVAWAAEPLPDKVDYNRDIKPILSDNCYACHGPDEEQVKGGLRLDSFAAATKELKSGARAIVPKDTEESELVYRVHTTDADELMPPAESNKSLTAREKALLKKWVAQGGEFAKHWAYVTPKKMAAPKVEQKGFTQNDIDRFILERLKANGFAPNKAADRRTLIRRLTFDLTGLPPTWAQVEAFVNDQSPDAYAKLVERLLASPQYGERMAVYWLDMVRFADTIGYHSDNHETKPLYREYVIDAFNNNKRYDQFTREQIAGDLIKDRTGTQLIASGYNRLNMNTREGGSQPKEYTAKYLADRVRNTSTVWMASTLGCSECHDHKFDPFTANDFYSFGAFFADLQETPVGAQRATKVPLPQDEAKITGINAEITKLEQQLAVVDVSAGQVKWEKTQQASAANAVTLSDWKRIGPFGAPDFDQAHAKAFIDESAVDLKKAYGKLKWVDAKNYVDGKVHTLTGGNSAHYFYRTIQSGIARQLELSLGSDDSFRIWLNGQLVADKKISRGVAPDQDKVTLNLKPGENQLLFKIANGSGGYGFYFKANQVSLPPAVLAALKVETGKRTAAQKNAVTAHYRTLAPELAAIRQKITGKNAEKDAAINANPTALVSVSMATPRMVRVLPRGNWLDDSGDQVQPAVPGFLQFGQATEGRASRMDLADWIVAKDNPLTARVFVNRLWAMFHGRGLATPLDDFGAQGTPPSHPALLDWLAIEFMENGWDVKHMVKLMVSSGTYRQSSVSPKAVTDKDPYNLWLARQGRWRLEAEMVRDNALAVSGLLVKTIGGASVKPYQPTGYWAHLNFPKRSWKADSGEGLYRRGLYTYWCRTFLHPSLAAFNAPSREECTVERVRSNTPQQALVLLNDPTYVEAARIFAERILKDGGKTPESRIAFAYQQALHRAPSAAEAKILAGLADKHLKHYQTDAPAADALLKNGAKMANEALDKSELAAWTSIARVVLNLHENITRN
ncbi:MAG: PSD1 domain-containing protein [Verrucomicrobia subdivision 3 bacterium]|nr:PSD1 domain-containing protein [Limisphaerales bacterium]